MTDDIEANKVPYAFDREFAPDGTILREGEHIKRLLTEDEARAIAECEVEMALAGEQAEAARETVSILKQLSARLQAIISRLDSESNDMREDAVRLAMATARTIASHALDQYGAETIESCVREALLDLRTEPRISIRVAPNLADTLAERIYEFAKREGLDNQIVVRADDEVAGGDCVLEWRTGAIERTQSDIEARIGEAVAKWLTHAQSETSEVAQTPQTPPEATDAVA